MSIRGAPYTISFQSPKNRVNILKIGKLIQQMATPKSKFQSPKNRVNILKHPRRRPRRPARAPFQSPKNRVNILKAGQGPRLP